MSDSPKFKKIPTRKKNYVATTCDVFGKGKGNKKAGRSNQLSSPDMVSPVCDTAPVRIEHTSSNNLENAAPVIQRALFIDPPRPSNAPSAEVQASAETLISRTHTGASMPPAPELQSASQTPESKLVAKLKRNGRGAGRCLKLDRMVKERGKLKIVFPPGEERPEEYGAEFSEAVGVAVRTNAELKNVYECNDLGDDEKEPCFTSLLVYQWFDIQDFGEDPRINAIVDHFCQDAYRRWRYTLAQYYRKDIKANRDHRLKSPRLEVPLAKRLKVCDHVSSESFEIYNQPEQ